MYQLIKFILSILLLICLFDMPYGYYQFVRFATMVGMGLFALKAYENSGKNETILYAVLALMFQPFLKLSFGREIWNVIDVVVAIILILSVIYSLKKKK